MVLGGVFLKIGLLGLLRAAAPVKDHVPLPVQVFVISNFLLGSIFLVFQNDLKRIVAVSSVVHINPIALSSFGWYREFVLGGVCIAAIAHTLISMPLFAIAGYLSDEQNGRRRSMIRSGLSRNTTMRSAILFIFIINIGAPLTITFFGEVIILAALAKLLKVSIASFMASNILIMLITTLAIKLGTTKDSKVASGPPYQSLFTILVCCGGGLFTLILLFR